MEPSLLVGLNILTTVVGFVVIGFAFGTRLGRLEGSVNGFKSELDKINQERRDCEARERDKMKAFEERLQAFEVGKKA